MYPGFVWKPYWRPYWRAGVTGMWGQETARNGRICVRVRQARLPLGRQDCCCAVVLGLCLLVNLSDSSLPEASSQSLSPPGPDRTGLDPALDELPGSLRMYWAAILIPLIVCPPPVGTQFCAMQGALGMWANKATRLVRLQRLALFPLHHGMACSKDQAPRMVREGTGVDVEYHEAASHHLHMLC